MSKGFWIIAGVLIGLPVFNQLYLPDHPVSVETKTGLIPTGTVDWCKVPVLGAADQGISYILPSMSFRCKEKLDAELRLKEEEEDRVRAGILRGKEIAGALSGRKLPEDNLGLVLPRPEIGGMPDAKAGLVRDGLKRSVFGGMLSEKERLDAEAVLQKPPEDSFVAGSLQDLQDELKRPVIKGIVGPSTPGLGQLDDKLLQPQTRTPIEIPKWKLGRSAPGLGQMDYKLMTKEEADQYILQLQTPTPVETPK